MLRYRADGRSRRRRVVDGSWAAAGDPAARAV